MSFVKVSAFSAFLCVALGAFGAHILKDAISEASLVTWNTAVDYHMFHSLAMLALSTHDKSQKQITYILNTSLWGFSLGIVLFCGSLYALALGAPSWAGFITPIGGGIWLLSWLNLVFRYSVRS